MNKIMDTSKHPTKGICTSKIEPIHKIDDTERKLAKVRNTRDKKSLDDIIFDSLKGRLFSFEDFCFSDSIKANSPKNCM